MKWTDVVQSQRIRKGGEQGHFSFLQKAGWGTVVEGGLVMTAYESTALALQSIVMKSDLLTAPWKAMLLLTLKSNTTERQA